MEVLPTRSPTHFPHTHSLSLSASTLQDGGTASALFYASQKQHDDDKYAVGDGRRSLPPSFHLSISFALARTGRRRKSRRREGHRPSSITNEATLPLLPPPPPPLMAAVVGREEATTSRGMREKCPRRAAPLEHPVGRGRRRQRLPPSEGTTTERAKERGQQRDGAREERSFSEHNLTDDAQEPRRRRRRRIY